MTSAVSGPVAGLTVLYDAGCPLCSRFRDWLADQALLVRLDLVPAGSAEARRRFPRLDHGRTLREVTVVRDDGAVWTGEHAWVMCLWATARHRASAERLARPQWLPLARGAACSAAGLRHLLGSTGRPGLPGLPGGPGGPESTGEVTGADYPGRCAGPCSPIAQG
ncbi:thiol-disulfide oxidoreductase DCC family protein [Nocardioides abyssi]|uniref:DCC1-like thiol-disulfide oxidoreductase family protein n=1 Tax=Nocardioides abyssi TaxID=3058370 RepID=A0ABT8ENM1_9ACTN|nr:DCC1-like thiol-disulfide oxidoreductase family protein [Nocardioides abyssi]MDN4159750.1 DCC1-like thiol-disulfide oxidoreductase family protein [Nocardioides abyssi]